MNTKFKILTGLRPPNGRPVRRESLDDLVNLAFTMKVGESVILTNSQSQTFRIVLAAQGFVCVTDGDHCPERGKTLAFKLLTNQTTTV